MPSFPPPPASARPHPCPACGSVRSHVEIAAQDWMLGVATWFYLGRCDACGFRHRSPRSDENLARHYPDAYEPYAAAPMRLGRAASAYARKRLGYGHLPAPRKGGPLRRLTSRFWGRFSAETRLIPRFTAGGTLLEVGCASGERLDLLRRLGWDDCLGIEYSEAAASIARAKGLRVLSGRLEDRLDEIPDGSLDAIVAAFVLEHLEDPFDAVRRLAAKLKPGGQLLASTLRIDSPDYRLYREYWYNLDFPRHFAFFRREDFHRLAFAGGLRLEGVRHQASVNDYVESARYRARFSGRRLFDACVLRLGRKLLPVCLALAWMGLASRVCLRFRKP